MYGQPGVYCQLPIPCLGGTNPRMQTPYPTYPGSGYPGSGYPGSYPGSGVGGWGVNQIPGYPMGIKVDTNYQVSFYSLNVWCVYGSYMAHEYSL